MAGMKMALRIVGSFVVSLVALVIGGFIRHPYACFDCFEPHGFPFTYRQDGGFGGGAAFFWGGMVGDLVVLILLTTLLAWTWHRSAIRERKHNRLG
jgi:hypothetical protein